MRRFLRLPRLTISSVLIGLGVVTFVGGALVNLAPWYESMQWRTSPEAARAQRNAEAAAPIWLTPAPSDAATPRSVATTPDASAARPTPTTSRPLLAAPRLDPPVQPTATSEPADPDIIVPAVPAPRAEMAFTPAPAAATLDLVATRFQFQDPPEPGARARLTVSVHNPTDTPSAPIRLVLPLDWLAGYRIETIDPAPLDGSQSRDRPNGSLRLTFDGPDARSDVDLTIDFVAIDEVIDAPMLQVLDAQGAQVGRVRPPTEAPPPRPGPIYSIDIPNLHMHAGVVPVDWEPPLFVVGQLRASAYVGQGNSVLVGHVQGAAGYNVFDHLDQLAPGDRVVASSRGQTYDFVVSQTQVLPEDDLSPTDSTSTPRLTLMTCAGTWNPLTRDFPDRLWVIAEPADAAAAAVVAEASPTPALSSASARPPQFSAHGGLGNTDADLAAAFGPPAGESSGLAVYPAASGKKNLEHRAELGDVTSASSAQRALLVADVAPADDPLTFEAAVKLSRSFLPTDAQPRAHGPEGNPRFIVERFTSRALAATLPPQWFTDRQGQPGDLLVVYARRPDGRIAFLLLGIGDNAATLLSRLPDVRGLSP